MNCCTAFGIDLGTTNSLGCIFRAGKLEIVTSRAGERLYPSCVAFPSNGKPSFLVGRTAKDRMRTREKEVIFDVKRLFGVDYNSQIVTNMKKTCSFEIESDENGKPVIAYTQNNMKHTKYPQEISAIVLNSIANDMKNFAGFDIKDIVITVPAYFNSHQRHLTEDAAKIAGLNVIEIITEPEAAAFAYMDINIIDDKERIILIYDLGGGTFDVTIMKVKGMRFEELALDGDLFLGGSDFDTLIMNEFIHDYENTGHTFPTRRLSKLRHYCEAAKIDLMSHHETTISEFDDEFNWTLTRSRMESVLQCKVEETLKVCQRALRSANLKPSDIDDIVFVGGSTRLNLVEKMVPEFFGKPVHHTFNPDECVAYGAAKYALYLQNHTERIETKSLQKSEPEVAPVAPEAPMAPMAPMAPEAQAMQAMQDFPDEPVAPLCIPVDLNASIPLPPIPSFDSDGNIIVPTSELPPPNPTPVEPTGPSMRPLGNGLELVNRAFASIGISDSKYRMKFMINKGRTIPYSRSVELHNTEPNITELEIPILEGEHTSALRNKIINRIKITGIQPKPVGENTFYMFFDMDKHGTLSIRVIDMDSGKDMTIRDINRAMTEEEVDMRHQCLQDEIEQNNQYYNFVKMQNQLINNIFDLMAQHPQYARALHELSEEARYADTVEKLNFITGKYQSFMYVCLLNEEIDSLLDDPTI